MCRILALLPLTAALLPLLKEPDGTGFPKKTYIRLSETAESRPTSTEPRIMLSGQASYGYTAGSDYPPTLLLHGDRDTDVPFEQSAEMARDLKQHGVEHESIRMTGYGHGFDANLDDARVASAFEHVMTFLKGHTQ